MLVGELEGLDETDGLLDGAADGEVVDGDLAGDAIWVMVVSTKASQQSTSTRREATDDGRTGVNDEKTTKSNTRLGDEDTVILRYVVILVGDERDLEVRAETALLAGEISPREVGAGVNYIDRQLTFLGDMG